MLSICNVTNILEFITLHIDIDCLYNNNDNYLYCICIYNKNYYIYKLYIFNINNGLIKSLSGENE